MWLELEVRAGMAVGASVGLGASVFGMSACKNPSLRVKKRSQLRLFRACSAGLHSKTMATRRALIIAAHTHKMTGPCIT